MTDTIFCIVWAIFFIVLILAAIGTCRWRKIQSKPFDEWLAEQEADE